jgi:hypothetical protein
LRLAAYEPPLVRFLDGLSAREKLHYGYAGYWQARPITMFSQRGLRAYAVDGMINPLFWVSNREWYVKSVEDRSKPPKIDFVVLDDPGWKITREAAVRVFGEPAREESFEGTRVLLYPDGRSWPSGGLDQPLTSFRQIITSPTASLEVRPGQEIRVPVKIRNPGAETWTAAGKYPVTVSYKWFDGAQMLPIEGERTVFPGAIGPGAATDLQVRVVAVDKPGRYALRITLVQEGVAWFMTSSNTYLELPVTVR